MTVSGLTRPRQHQPPIPRKRGGATTTQRLSCWTMYESLDQLKSPGSRRRIAVLRHNRAPNQRGSIPMDCFKGSTAPRYERNRPGFGSTFDGGMQQKRSAAGCGCAAHSVPNSNATRRTGRPMVEGDDLQPDPWSSHRRRDDRADTVPAHVPARNSRRAGRHRGRFAFQYRSEPGLQVPARNRNSSHKPCFKGEPDKTTPVRPTAPVSQQRACSALMSFKAGETGNSSARMMAPKNQQRRPKPRPPEGRC